MKETAITSRKGTFVNNVSNSIYQQIIESTPVAIYTCDVHGVINFYNQAAVELWGRAPQIGEEMWCGSFKIFDTAGNPVALDTCPMAVALKERRAVVGHEIVVQRPDGTRLNVVPYPRPLFDARGNFIGAANLLLDISQLKKATNQVADSEDRFRTLAEKAPVMIWMTNEFGKGVYVNPRWKAVTGKESLEELVEQWSSIIHPDDREVVLKAWEKSAAEEISFQQKYRLLTADQNFIIVRSTATPVHTHAGEFRGFIGLIEDITLAENTTAVLEHEVQRRTNDLLRKNEELRRSEERYHKMVAEVQDYAIILLDKDGIVQNWNKGAQQIKGYTAEEAVGMNFRLFYTDEDQANKLPEYFIGQAVQLGKSAHEGWRVRKDGTKFWGSVVITSLHDGNNNVIGFSKVTRDLTERKRAEEAHQKTADEIKIKNRELEKMNQELASFAYVSSHDLQEPLRKIQTFASRIVETEKNLSDKGKDYFERMQNAAFRMQTLIEDLLAYSRTNTSEKKFETVDLNKLLEDVKNDLRERIDEKRATINADRLPVIDVIVFQFRQLLTNILSNALKFSKPDVPPVITIKYQIQNGRSLKTENLERDATYHVFSVTDNGIGFEPEHQTKIFEVFQRLHGRSEYTGTGIGLAICKKIVENHGGVIYAESELGRGATFVIAIPAK